MANGRAKLSIKIEVPGREEPVEFELADISISLLEKGGIEHQKTVMLPNTDIQEELISTEEMAALLKKSPSTLRNWVRAGKINVCRVGRSVFFDKRAVIEKIQQTAEKSVPGLIRLKRA